MKKIFYLLIVALFAAQCTPKTGEKVASSPKDKIGNLKIGTASNGKLDRSKPPIPKPAPKIQMGSYESFTLDNGLEVIVVQNNKIPRVSFQYSLNIDPVAEKDAAGIKDIMGQMLRRGTKNRTKTQIDEAVDFIGGTLNTTANGVFASSLTKHSDLLLELMADVLLNPTFPEKELEKIKKQTLSGLASNKNDPNVISRNVAKALRYGKEHPYGEVTTEATIKNITIDKIKNYYETYFKPNAGHLIIVGDIDAKKAKDRFEKMLGNWQKKKVPTHKYKMPKAPKVTKVNFVDKPGAVQSVITITYPIDLKTGSKDVIAASVTNSILGGSFGSRLMQNLREDKAYTYGVGSRIASDPVVGYFMTRAAVRNEVTDSAITQFIYEINRMATEKVSEAVLQKTKNIMTGDFARALERPQTVANFAANIAKYNLPKDYYETYLTRLAAVTVDDVQRVAKKYLSTKKAHMLVVGDKEKVAKKLKKFSKTGVVDFYDNYGNPIKAANGVLPKDITAKQVIDNYLTAIGGKAAIQNVKDISTEIEMSIRDRNFSGIRYQKHPNKLKLELRMGKQIIQEQIFDGKAGIMKVMGQKQKIEGEGLKIMQEQATLFPELLYESATYTLVLKGIETVNGSDAYKIIITSAKGNKSTAFYDVKSGLKVKSISMLNGPQGKTTQIEEYQAYKEFQAIKFPSKIQQSVMGQNITLSQKNIEINTNLSDDIFKVK